MARESQLINSWIREGEDRGRLEVARESLLKLVRHLIDPVPESIHQAIVHWFDAALDVKFGAKTISELLQEVRLDPVPIS